MLVDAEIWRRHKTNSDLSFVMFVRSGNCSSSLYVRFLLLSGCFVSSVMLQQLLFVEETNSVVSDLREPPALNVLNLLFATLL